MVVAVFLALDAKQFATDKHKCVRVSTLSITKRHRVKFVQRVISGVKVKDFLNSFLDGFFGDFSCHTVSSGYTELPQSRCCFTVKSK